MKEKIPLLEFIQSDKFILYVAIFTVVFLAPNTYYVFSSFSVFSTPFKEIVSVGVSMIIASSILIYTVRKNAKMANYYAWFEACISIYYYIDILGWHWSLIPAIGFAIIMPVSVKYYSKELFKNEIILPDQPQAPSQADIIDFLNKNPGKRPSDFKY